jgi:hypothetical protein
MNRRDSLKAIAIGSLGAGAVLGSIHSANGETVVQDPGTLYGRTPAEKAHDAKLKTQKFFTGDEMASLAILCNIIIPADSHSGSASDAEVPQFIEFMMKDQPHMQIPVRGGLKWLDIKSFKLFNKSFVNADKQQRVQLISLIAYPETAAPEDMAGVSFFNTVRNLTATGFFTSKIGIEDLQYKGNTPNAWDGVPEDVLKQYGLEYDKKTLEHCLKDEDRGKIMTWG